MQSQALTRLALEVDLRHAIDRGELRVAYQPIVDLSTSTIVGIEALVRWQHPKRGLLSPGEFIPLAEETGLIVEIDRFVLAEACRQTRDWNARRDCTRLLFISVNLSAPNLRQPDVFEHIEFVLDATDLAPEQLQLELTETMLLQDAVATLQTLHRFNELGIRLAIDDFGTGYSSLSYLTRFPVAVVKIDRTFISGSGMSDRTMPMVTGITQLCHALQLQVTAEGIETASQLASARLAGCDFGQGYFFSKPAPAAGIEALLLGTI